MRCVRDHVEGIAINHSRVSSIIRVRRLSRVSMSGQIALSRHRGTASSIGVNERAVPPPPSYVDISTEQDDKAIEFRDEAAEAAAASKLSATHQEATAQERHDVRGMNNTRTSPPPVASLIEYSATDGPGKGFNSATAPENEVVHVVTTNMSSVVVPEISTKPDDSALTTDALFPCMDNTTTPSSPSKKKKKNKKKKKRKSSPEEKKLFDSHDSSDHKEVAITELPGEEPASEPNTIAFLTDSVERDKPSTPNNDVISKVVHSHPVHHSIEKNEINFSNKSNELALIRPDQYVTDAPTNTNADKFHITDNIEKMESIGQSNELSTTINSESSTQENQSYEPDDGAWETVEKPRGRRKKGVSKNVSHVVQQNTKSPMNSNANNVNGQHYDGANEHVARIRRQKRYKDKNRSNNNNNQHSNNSNHQQNKMVKDVILHILDAVDIEIRAKSTEGNRSKSNGHHNLSHLNNGGHRRHQLNSEIESSPKLPLPSMVSNSSVKSLRDVVTGTSKAAVALLSKDSLTAAQPKGAGGKAEQSANGSSKVKPGLSYKSVIEPTAVSKPPQPPPQHQPSAPKPNAWVKPPPDIKLKKIDELKKKAEVKPLNVQSQSEEPGQNRLVVSSVADEVKEKLTLTTSCNGETQHRHSVSTLDDDGSPPPLATLLGPGTSYSASSSVASSLEAPHSSANRFRHQSSSNNTEDDVGYHLLNVCGQLSEEINAFMSRRALALDVRRKERNAVLNALGDTLGKIWPGQCRVEMYGSCATQLDLPSSDLDLVVCGLDDFVGEHMIPPPPLVDQSSHKFIDQEEVSQECVPISLATQSDKIPMSPDVNEQQKLVARISSTGHFLDKVGDSEQSSPDSLVSSCVTGGDRAELILLECVEHDTVTGVGYSPGRVSMENCSQGEVVASEADYSPEYSYHSQQNNATDNYTLGYENDDANHMEGYGHYHTNGQEFYYASPYSFVSSLPINAQRVLRLASELELQPWAVQVKAIPTATVPVVKMLADPSKLPGLVGTGGSWRMQQHIPAQSGVASAGSNPTPISPDQVSSPSQQGSVLSSSAHFFSSHPMLTQWRGADIMNGLQPVDITFEGPEHGGIGSTTYSARVVQDACEETGLAPDSTPVVQVASVLKELLAQRRLNEPFSGGLSSYGLLLLLLAVLKDRKIIQEEMKKVEMQRQMVRNDESRPLLKQRKSSCDPLPQHRSASTETPAIPVNYSSPGADSSDKSALSTISKPNTSSSWASIAKKSNGSTARTDTLSTMTKSTTGSASAMTIAAKAVGEGFNSDCRRRESIGVRQGKSDKLSSKTLLNANELKKGDISALKSVEASAERKQIPTQGNNSSSIDGPSVVISQVTSSSEADSCKMLRSSNGPQGSNDVLEVLCSGELTSGKLLMHFLLFYGQQFDARLTSIDINGTHHPQYGMVDFDRLSPFAPRPPGGTIDPITGMFSVDPIVVYDPLEGAVDHNVSKRCYCWNNVKWVFAQCYMTVSSIVETSDTRLESNKSSNTIKAWHREKSSSNSKLKEDQEPILEHFLSF